MKKIKKGLLIATAFALLLVTCTAPVSAEGIPAPSSSFPPLSETGTAPSTPDNTSGAGSQISPSSESAPADTSAASAAPGSVAVDSSVPPESSGEGESEVREKNMPVPKEGAALPAQSEAEEVKNTVILTVHAEDEADTSGLAFTVVELDKTDFLENGVATEVSKSVHVTEDGKLVLTNLAPNVYTFEAEPLEQYQPAFKVCLTVEEYGEFSDYLNLLLPEQRGDLEIQLNAPESEEVPDVVFFTITGDEYAESYAVGANASEKIEGLEPGTYSVALDALEGYEAHPAQTIEVKDGEVASLTLTMPKYVGIADEALVAAQGEDTRPGALSLVVASDDGKTAGVAFEVKGAGGTKTGKTGKDGQLFMTGFEADEYTVTQLPRKGYAVGAPKTVRIEHGKTVCETFYNTKEDSRGHLSIQLPAGGGGSSFGVIFNIKGKNFDSDVWTDHTGGKTVYNLQAGEYVITPKTQAGADLSTPQKVVVENGKTVTANFDA